MDGIIGNAVALFVDRLGADPEAMTAAIGPCIGSCCYEVDEETAATFVERFGAGRVSGRFLDLGGAVADDLASAGVGRDNIFRLDICTCCNPDFYSYRRDGVTGRHGAIAWIES